MSSSSSGAICRSSSISFSLVPLKRTAKDNVGSAGGGLQIRRRLALNRLSADGGDNELREVQRRHEPVTLPEFGWSDFACRQLSGVLGTAGLFGSGAGDRVEGLFFVRHSASPRMNASRMSASDATSLFVLGFSIQRRSVMTPFTRSTICGSGISFACPTNCLS